MRFHRIGQGCLASAWKAIRMTKRFLAVAILCALVLPAANAAGAEPQVTMLAQGDCVVAAPIAGPWDVYEDMFAADAPTWLPSHTHNGIECTLGTRGTTMWWFAGQGKTPVNVGSALLTVPGRVHTAGNDGPAAMTYFALHVLVAGSPYRTLVPDPSAPPVVSTNGASLFHNIFPNQPALAGPFTVRLHLVAVAVGGGMGGAQSNGTRYFTLVSGAVAVTAGGKTTTYGPAGQWSVAPGVDLAVKNTGKAPAIIGIARIF
jgi:quercetin dioxygenase-like cupin family protein